jgi:hypothetical protein
MNLAKNLPKNIALCNGLYTVKRLKGYWGVFCD